MRGWVWAWQPSVQPASRSRFRSSQVRNSGDVSTNAVGTKRVAGMSSAASTGAACARIEACASSKEIVKASAPGGAST